MKYNIGSLKPINRGLKRRLSCTFSADLLSGLKKFLVGGWVSGPECQKSGSRS